MTTTRELDRLMEMEAKCRVTIGYGVNGFEFIKSERLVTPIDVRFDANWIPEPNSGCYLWTGRYNSKTRNYGAFSVSRVGRKGWTTIQAHRYAYAREYGQIPAGLQIDHLCRNTACVNPRHLEAVSGIENNRRSQSPTANNSRKERCPVGHPLVGTRADAAGVKRWRYCQICQTERTRQTRDEYARLGLCRKCGTKRAEGRAMCSTCIEKQRSHREALAEQIAIEDAQ